MKRLMGLPILMAGAGIALAACGTAATYGSTTTATSPSAVAASSAPAYGQPASATPSATSVPQPAGSQLASRATGLGQILVDARGISLYLFEADHGTTSVCYGSCAQNWPPLLTSGSPTVMGNLSPMLIGTTARTDGTRQVTYNGHPLYFFVGDRKPGDTTGEGINAFGGGWDVVSPSGAKIEGGNS
jgi:predicted lipoprotein with Yx(FWY)xxD motif